MTRPPYTRYRLTFEKKDDMRFIGHLDTLALFERCITLAKLPICLSQGYSARMQLAFALPLGLGQASTAEVLDIDLTQNTDPQHILTSLNNHLPIGISILTATQLAQGAKTAPRLVTAATYHIGPIPEGYIKTMDQSLATFLNNTEVNVSKKTKKGEKLTNIRPLVLDASIQGNTLVATLATGEQNLKPQLLVSHLMKYENQDQDDLTYIRTSIHL